MGWTQDCTLCLTHLRSDCHRVINKRSGIHGAVIDAGKNDFRKQQDAAADAAALPLHHQEKPTEHSSRAPSPLVIA